MFIVAKIDNYHYNPYLASRLDQTVHEFIPDSVKEKEEEEKNDKEKEKKEDLKGLKEEEEEKGDDEEETNNKEISFSSNLNLNMIETVSI